MFKINTKRINQITKRYNMYNFAFNDWRREYDDILKHLQPFLSEGIFRNQWNCCWITSGNTLIMLSNDESFDSDSKLPRLFNLEWWHTVDALMLTKNYISRVLSMQKGSTILTGTSLHTTISILREPLWKFVRKICTPVLNTPNVFYCIT